MFFYDPSQSAESVQSTHKSSYHCTGMFGVTAGGEVLPPHFQLPTAARNLDDHQIPIKFIEHMHTITGNFGFDDVEKTILLQSVSMRKGG
jgi:hypothetical protein